MPDNPDELTDTLFAATSGETASEVAAAAPQPDELSFREASEELEAVVRALEDESLDLEEALTRYERGVALLRSLRARLTSAQQKVTVLMGELEPDSSDDVDTSLS